MSDVIVLAAPGRRPRHPNATAEEKAEAVKRFTESGMTHREFCRQNGLGTTTLQNWLRQVRAQTPRPFQTNTDFVEVTLPAPGLSSRWAAEVCRSNGTIVRLAHDIAPELLNQVLRAC